LVNSRKRKKNKNSSVLKFLLLALAIVVIAFFWYKGTHNKNTNTTNNVVVSNNISNNNATENAKTEEKKPSVVEKLTAEEIEESKKRGLPVLMYHFFYDEQAGETGKDANFMEIHAFEEQIKYLAENEYYIPTWEEVLGYVEGKNGLPLKSVILTVDDGDESFFRLAVPVLQKYNITATSFLITSWYTSPIDTSNYKNVDFQSHSHKMHQAGSNGKGLFLTISYEDGCKDLETCRTIIENGCRVFCYPFGHFNDNCKKMLKDCNYILAFTTQGGRVYPGDDPLELPRVRMSKGDTLNAFISKIK
jgi:hypothetical protein